DALAGFIPSDQHVLFLPSIDAAFAIQQQMQSSSLPILQSLTPSGQDESIMQRYQRQLGLETTGLAKLLGPAMVRSVALTGSDPFFSMGTDVAVIFETPDPQSLKALLMLQIAQSASAGGAKAVAGEIIGVPYSGYLSDGRVISSYVADL